MAGGTDAYRIDEDGWTLRSSDGTPGAHFEHTIAIIADGPEYSLPPTKCSLGANREVS